MSNIPAAGKRGNEVTFADVVHQLLTFSTGDPTEALLLRLIDSPWVQRLRDVSQTANTRLVYMFSEHSRFGHCVGVSYLALQLMKHLRRRFPEIEQYYTAVACAALLHDIGHLAPGSHTAWKTWFPGQPDTHEQIATRIIAEDKELHALLHDFDPALPKQVNLILDESPELPPWTWEIISGGGWNVDRGNWCIVDSILAGVSYGRYNIPALTDAMLLTSDRHLALSENRLDAMMHFAVSRHAMYRQMYQHRVLLSADTLNRAIAQRARDLGANLAFADSHMALVLQAKDALALPLSTVFAMREPWWRYHLLRWSEGSDATLADLSQRLINRRLFKTVRVLDHENKEELRTRAAKAASELGFDPRYYLHEISTFDTNAADYRQSMPVVMDDGRSRHLTDADPLFGAMSNVAKRTWLAMPAEAKQQLQRQR